MPASETFDFSRGAVMMVRLQSLLEMVILLSVLEVEAFSFSGRQWRSVSRHSFLSASDPSKFHSRLFMLLCSEEKAWAFVEGEGSSSLSCVVGRLLDDSLRLEKW